MIRTTVLATSMRLPVTTYSACAYEPWIPDTGPSEVLADMAEAVANMEEARERATASRSANPLSLEGLKAMISALRISMDNLSIQIDQPSRQAQPAGYVPVATSMATPTLSHNLTGTWSIMARAANSTMVIKQTQTSITGTVIGDPIVDGEILPDGSVSLVRKGPDQVCVGRIIRSSSGSLTREGTCDCPITGMKNAPWHATLQTP